MGTLIDAGPLVALLNPWPCITEAMYLLGRDAGWSGQALLWSLIENGQLAIHPSTAAETRRMCMLMEKYQDAPMRLADDSLVAAVET